MDLKSSLYAYDGSGITGSSDLVVKIKRDADNYFFDFDDSTFKTSGHTDIDSEMSDIDATNVPGEYELSVDVSGWDDGVYTVYYEYGGSPSWVESDEIVVLDGALAVHGVTALDTTVDAIKVVTDYLNKWVNNKLVVSGTSLILYDDDGSTVLKTWTLSTGTLTTAAPINRSAAV